MKSTPLFAALFIEASIVTADYIKNGMLFQDSPSPAPVAAVPTLAPRAPPLSCLFEYEDATPTSVGPIDPEFDLWEYCSEYIKPKAGSTVTRTSKATNVVTATVSATTTIGTTVTTTLPGSGSTTTALCPIPTAGQNCGAKGWGYATNNIYTGSGIDGSACHQLCLGNTACRSFQVQDASEPSPQCNLYNVDSSANNTIPGSTAPFTFYDRGCQDLIPSGCTKPKKLARDAENAMVTARAELAPTPPFWLTMFPPLTVSLICGCILDVVVIPGQGGGPVVTKTVYSTTVASTIVTKATTAYTTATTTVGGGSGIVTSYVSVKRI